MAQQQQKTSPSSEEIKSAVITATLELAIFEGWANLRLQDIANEANIDMGDMAAEFSDKTDILYALGRRIDARTLKNIPAREPEVSHRERLFDIMMERFEALNDMRQGIIAILHDLGKDPGNALCSLPHLGRSCGWMLEAAGISASGVKGAVRIAGLSAIYLKVLRTWMDDDSEDLSQTMAALDREIGRAESWAGTLRL